MLMLLFIAGVVSELSLTIVPFFWRYRQWLAPFVVSLVGLFSGLVTVQYSLLTVAILLALSAFRIFSTLRLTKRVVQEHYLRRALRRTSVWLVLAQAAVLLLVQMKLAIDFSTGLLMLTFVQLCVSSIILGVTAKNLFKTRHHQTHHFYSDRELPTVTVAIPARNETNDLSSCLQSIIANNYPKLEILVLDDCSQDRTSEIIKAFAHDGVRFLEGHPPDEHWLAKNQAYHQLTEHATGELILFCGVDVRMSPDAIRSLVTTLLNKKRSMLSVMPLRIGGGLRTAFIQPMRYWWELALPRRFFNRPPVLSTCWLITRKTLKKLGGFKAVSHTIIPEGYFARELIKTDQYAFIRADEQLDVRTVKSIESQLSTTVRTRYPQLRKRPENVLLLSLMELIFLLMPFVIGLVGLWTVADLATWLALLASFLLIGTHYLILAASNPANSMIALFNFPFVVLTELVIVYISMYRYEFSIVEWKGRNVCIPVMQIIPNLPRLKN